MTSVNEGLRARGEGRGVREMEISASLLVSFHCFCQFVKSFPFFHELMSVSRQFVSNLQLEVVTRRLNTVSSLWGRERGIG